MKSLCSHVAALPHRELSRPRSSLSANTAVSDSTSKGVTTIRHPPKLTTTATLTTTTLFGPPPSLGNLTTNLRTSDGCACPSHSSESMHAAQCNRHHAYNATNKAVRGIRSVWDVSVLSARCVNAYNDQSHVPTLLLGPTSLGLLSDYV